MMIQGDGRCGNVDISVDLALPTFDLGCKWSGTGICTGLDMVRCLRFALGTCLGTSGGRLASSLDTVWGIWGCIGARQHNET